MKPSEIREKTDDELVKLEKDLREEFFRIRIKQSTGQTDKTHRLKEIRKDIARLLTIKGEKEAGEAL